ncbi:MAG TPA: DinB family protein [Gemmatimonadaceae bacterium]|jgi:uncharacterized damage-inducible protein DinB|nr:DinB family protein [Gemmatimonadaceae bacterium]
MPQTDNSAKARFLRNYERETATTLRVMHAYPVDKTDFRPHERSNNALHLGWTFVVEQAMLLRALRGEDMFGSGYGKPPENWQGILDAFKGARTDVMSELGKPENQDLDGSVVFMVAPKQKGEVPLADFVEFMLGDQIHHRGQLSVYLRMAGGKVPSIYGPSADEPWM